VTDLACARVRYSLVTRDDGGVLDDVLVYHLPESDRDDAYLLVVNAGNRHKIWNWLLHHLPVDHAVQIRDDTLTSAMIAVQGPLACTLVREQLGLDQLAAMAYFSSARGILYDRPLLFSRTGYTGEDGVELILPAEIAVDVWQKLLQAGSSQGVLPAGLGARDTLRLEAAMPLYGHELTEQISPWQAGLAFAVDLADRSFPGHEALCSMDTTTLPCRVGLRVASKRVARQHAVVLDAHGHALGEVSSGTFSPTLQQSIAMAYLPPEHTQLGHLVRVDIRGQQESATVVRLPFYRRSAA
jgi:aminomethyltransferase